MIAGIEIKNVSCDPYQAPFTGGLSSKSLDWIWYSIWVGSFTLLNAVLRRDNKNVDNKYCKKWQSNVTDDWSLLLRIRCRRRLWTGWGWHHSAADRSDEWCRWRWLRWTAGAEQRRQWLDDGCSPGTQWLWTHWRIRRLGRDQSQEFLPVVLADAMG